MGAVGTALAGAVAAPADTVTENMDLHGAVNDIPALYAEVPATYITPDQRMREIIRELGGAAQDLANAGAGVLKRRELTGIPSDGFMENLERKLHENGYALSHKRK